MSSRFMYNGVPYNSYEEMEQAKEYYRQQQKIQNELKRQNDLMERQIREQKEQVRRQQLKASNDELANSITECLIGMDSNPTPLNTIILGIIYAVFIGGFVYLCTEYISSLIGIGVGCIILIYNILKAINLSKQQKELKRQEELKKQQELQELEMKNKVENTTSDPITSYSNKSSKSKNNSFLSKILSIILIILVLTVIIAII